MAVEVKPGRHSKRHVALDRLMGTKSYGLSRAVVLHPANVSQEGSVTYLPLYMAAYL